MRKRVFVRRGICLAAMLFANVSFAQLPRIPLGPIRIEVQPVANGLSAPIDLLSAHDGSNRLFIVEQTG